MISSHNYPSLIQLTKLSWLNISMWFLQKHNFLECQISVVSLRDLSLDFFRLRWASFPINLVEFWALSWPFYNFKYQVLLFRLLNVLASF